LNQSEGGAVIEILADNNFGDTRAGGLAGPTGLVVILLLVVATIFLIRNMNARLRRLPASFEATKAPTATEADATDVAESSEEKAN
jgi:hypothetical protein